jgi:hypothetical protein
MPTNNPRQMRLFREHLDHCVLANASVQPLPPQHDQMLRRVDARGTELLAFDGA